MMTPQGSKQQGSAKESTATTHAQVSTDGAATAAAPAFPTTTLKLRYRLVPYQGEDIGVLTVQVCERYL